MNYSRLDKLVNAGIVVACVTGIMLSFSTWQEMGRAAETLEWSKRAAPMVTVTVEPAASMPEAPGEDPEEDTLIEEALLEQGYFRDDVPLTYDLQDALHTACEEFEIRYELALAVIERETNFTATVGDGGESIGWFQIQPKWWGKLMDEIGVDDPADPAQNFRLGCAILAQLIDRYGNETDALTAYNTGRPGESEYAAAVLEIAVRYAGTGRVDDGNDSLR